MSHIRSMSPALILHYYRPSHHFGSTMTWQQGDGKHQCLMWCREVDRLCSDWVKHVNRNMHHMGLISICLTGKMVHGLYRLHWYLLWGPHCIFYCAHRFLPCWKHLLHRLMKFKNIGIEPRTDGKFGCEHMAWVEMVIWQLQLSAQVLCQLLIWSKSTILHATSLFKLKGRSE